MSGEFSRVIKQLDDGYEIDDEAEDERLFLENPDAYAQKRADEQEHAWKLRDAAWRRLTKA